MSLNHKNLLNNLEGLCLEESAGTHGENTLGGYLTCLERIMVSVSFFSTRLMAFVRANTHFMIIKNVF